MDQVTNLQYSVTGPNGVLITWDVVTGATEYLVEIRQNNEELFSQTVTVPEVPYDLITFGELYEVLVKATDGTETSDQKRLVVYLATSSWLPRVTDLAYTELGTRDGFIVTWGPSQAATSYRLIAETYGDSPVVVYDGVATSPFTLNGLAEETLYRVTVIPVNGAVEGIAATVVGWIAPVVDSSRNKKTSHLLFPAEVQADYRLLYRQNIENMRPLREDERYWRFVDHFDFIDGPPEIGEVYTKENITWRVALKGGPSGDNSTIYVTKLGERDSENVSQDIYTHTAAIDAVSLEFDQNGRLLILFESLGEIFLYWYDPLEEQTVLKSFGFGRTPVACTDNYWRLGGSAASERFMFFVEDPSRKIVAYRQLDRYDVKYVINPEDSREVLELLQVSKTLDGGLAVVAAVQEVDGSVVQVVWVSRENGANSKHVNSDRDIWSAATMQLSSGAVSQFSVYDARNAIHPVRSTAGLSFNSGVFNLIDSVVNIGKPGGSYQGTHESAEMFFNQPVFTLYNVSKKASLLSAEELQLSAGQITLYTEFVDISLNDSAAMTFESGSLNNFSIS